ncbi:hypothetical protein GCM10010411_89560 [Actinomadura fulvescens]|uniref:Uncharacterized protein n=1 Tax=Actinomadura fulvescens TaxID=46160 RepID=A0ABN3QVI9_9ACTN
MSDARDSSGDDGEATPGYTVPTRPDGWPDLLRRRPLSSTERARLRARLGPVSKSGSGWSGVS